MGFLDNSENDNKKTNLTFQEIAQKYSVILSFELGEKIKIDLISNSPDRSRFFIKDDYHFFSTSQKAVLKAVRDVSAWQAEIDLDLFFKNLKQSGFALYYKNDKKKIKKIFWKKAEKIKIDFFQATEKDFFPLQKNDFVLRFSDQNYFSEIESNYIFSPRAFYYIKNNNLLSINLTAKNKEIFNRIFNKKYNLAQEIFSEKFETKLTEEEILNINSLLKNLANNFNLQSSIKPNFKIKKFSAPEKEIEIYCDFKKEVLEIKPILNYHFAKIDISESVKKISQKGNYIFIRKFNKNFGFKYLIQIKKNQIFYTEIDFKKEIEFYRELLISATEFGFSPKLKLNISGQGKIFLFIKNKWPKLKKQNFTFVFLKDKLDSKKLKFKADFKIDYQQKSGKVHLGTKFFIGKNQFSFADLQKNFSQKNYFFIDNKGHRVAVENKEDLQNIIELIDKFEQSEKNGKFIAQTYNMIELNNIFTSSTYYSAKFDQGFKKFISEANQGKVIEKIKISAKNKKILRPYQKAGLDWMFFLQKYHLGGILADDMGLGKTIQALAMLEESRQKKPSLIVVPKSLIHNWADEIKKFTKNLSYLILDGNINEREDKFKQIKKFNIILTSYSLFQKDYPFYREHNFHYVIIDEAQYIKNFRSKNAILLKKINADFRLALSGTPLENSIKEIWSVFDFLMPGLLESYHTFIKKYYDNEKNLIKLKNKIYPFILRRTKDEVLKELPPKNLKILKIDLSEGQKILYGEILKKSKEEIFADGNVNKKTMHILAALTRLRQICNHPALLLNTEKYYQYKSPKLNLAINLIKEIQAEGRKVLVFSQFRKMLEILEKELNKNNIQNISLTGQSKNRPAIIKKFNEDNNLTVFLISLKAGGVGLNLTSADNVIIFDPWWNPAVENQAIDRSHRIGQRKKVDIYKLVSKNTIEDKILELQKNKADIFKSLIGQSENSLKNLNWNDLREIFE